MECEVSYGWTEWFDKVFAVSCLNYSIEFGLLVSYAIKLSVLILASEKQANNILVIDNLTCKPVVTKFCQYISAYIENVIKFILIIRFLEMGAIQGAILSHFL
jgi:hypothetical protein